MVTVLTVSRDRTVLRSIDEATGLPYASCNTGIMHACGHDGHTAMLLAAAKHIALKAEFSGTVNLIDLQPPRWPEALHAFVDVVSGHPQKRVFVAFGLHHGLGNTKRGSIRMASAFEGEKHWSAAACQGSHCASVCSRGLSTTGMRCGTHRPNTRSVLRLTPGA